MTRHHLGFTHSFAATELDTRHALSTIMARLRQIGLTDEQAGSIEIALAEVVNNIVEHAYAGLEQGNVVIRTVVANGFIRVLLVDWGPPLPGRRLPNCRPASIGEKISDLPEGGFGWYLIYTLTGKIHYRRLLGRNHLRLLFRQIPPVVPTQHHSARNQPAPKTP